MKRPPITSFAACIAMVFALPAAAQDNEAAPAMEQEPVEAAAQDPTPVIVVTAEQEREAEQRVEKMTRAITRRPRVDKPIARQYGQICVGIVGLKSDLAVALGQRVYENARRLDIGVAPDGCQVNTLIAFVDDARAEVEDLRKSAPWLFETLLDYEYERVLRGNGGAHAWHSFQVKEADGKELAVIEVGDPPRQVQSGDPFNATRMAQQIRTDIIGSVVIIDRDRVPGKTIQQLADYASIRSFASVDDLSNGGPNDTPTILSLFEADGVNAEGLTEFDWSYLEALYRLPVTARGSAVHDATWTSYRRRVLKLQD